MKTLQELYTEIMASEDLKKAFAQAQRTTRWLTSSKHRAATQPRMI